MLALFARPPTRHARIEGDHTLEGGRCHVTMQCGHVTSSHVIIPYYKYSKRFRETQGFSPKARSCVSLELRVDVIQGGKRKEALGTKCGRGAQAYK
jgi:hypothetical protein